MPKPQLNAVYSSRTMKRRYEVWFLRCGLADGTGAWWFRYLLMNLGRSGCSTENAKTPVQIWATWFPHHRKAQTFIQGFSAHELDLTGRFQLPFHLRIGENGIDENSCWGNISVDGHAISWNLRNRSNFGLSLSDKGWIGFTKSPHSDALSSGEIIFDNDRFTGDPLGFGVQGHNCGYRHRTFWRWMHAHFLQPDGSASTLEAVVYDMPFGLLFRKAVLWHKGNATILKNLREKEIVREPRQLKWSFTARRGDLSIEAIIEAEGPGIHVLPYVKTDCSGTFPVSNASLARATLWLGNNPGETLETATGAVLEMGGNES
jgi:hypothetical protein